MERRIAIIGVYFAFGALSGVGQAQSIHDTWEIDLPTPTLQHTITEQGPETALQRLSDIRDRGGLIVLSGSDEARARTEAEAMNHLVEDFMRRTMDEISDGETKAVWHRAGANAHPRPGAIIFGRSQTLTREVFFSGRVVDVNVDTRGIRDHVVSYSVVCDDPKRPARFGVMANADFFFLDTDSNLYRARMKQIHERLGDIVSRGGMVPTTDREPGVAESFLETLDREGSPWEKDAPSAMTKGRFPLSLREGDIVAGTGVEYRPWGRQVLVFSGRFIGRSSHDTSGPRYSGVSSPPRWTHTLRIATPMGVFEIYDGGNKTLRRLNPNSELYSRRDAMMTRDGLPRKVGKTGTVNPAKVSDSDVFDASEDREATRVSGRVGEVLSEEDRRAEKEALAKMTPEQRAEYSSIREAGNAVKDAIRKVIKK